MFIFVGMKATVDLLKGIHPGIVLEQELKKRGLGKGRFALAIQEFPQTITAITKGKRDMNTPLALRIEHELGLEEGYFMTLQIFYDIKQEKKKMEKAIRPDLSLLRPAIFWDTDLQKIDWKRQKRAVIERVWERGNEREKAEMKRLYGEQEIESVLKTIRR
jgi:plasmid maintenance system antidote protein VapI